MQLLLVILLFLALVIAALTLQNQESMAFRLFFWTVEVSKILVILGSAFLGALAVFLAGLFQRLRRKAKEEAAKAAAKETPVIDGAAPGGQAAKAADQEMPVQ